MSINVLLKLCSPKIRKIYKNSPKLLEEIMILKDQQLLNLQERNLLGSACPGKAQLPVKLVYSLEQKKINFKHQHFKGFPPKPRQFNLWLSTCKSNTSK